MSGARVASFAELDGRTAYALWALRQRVFVVEQQCAYLDLDGLDLAPATRHVWVPDAEGDPAAYLRVLDVDEACPRIGRVVVAPEHRGSGLAGRLMDAALHLVGDRPSRLSAQSYLVTWYARLGYAPDGPEFLDDGIPHTPMLRPARSL